MLGNPHINMYGYKNSMNVYKKPAIESKPVNVETHDVEIGDRGIHVKVSNYGGTTRCDMRHFFYHEDQQLWFPTRKGVSLSMNEFKQLKDIIPQMLDCMDEQERLATYGIPTEDKFVEPFIRLGIRFIHVKVSSFNGSYRCHIRHYNNDDHTKDGWYPTKKGIALNLKELNLLNKSMPKLNELMDMIESKSLKRNDEGGNEKPVKKMKITESALSNSCLVEHSDYYGEYLPDYSPQV